MCIRDREAQRAGIAAARAGVPGKSIDAAARKVIEDAGYGDYFGHGYGHSVGIEIHESPNANTREETIMPVGAAVSAEPDVYKRQPPGRACTWATPGPTPPWTW